MNLIALDTCFDACSAAAGRGVRSLTPTIAFEAAAMAKGHAEQLMPMIETVMSAAGLSFSALDRIAVTAGPGTFAGTRISVAAARALSLATGAPIVAYSSLNLMAMSPRIPAARHRRLAIATDARRGEVYFQLFHRVTSAPLTPPRGLALKDAGEALYGPPIAIAGNGAAALAEAARAAGIDAEAILPDLLPDAIDMLFVASEQPGEKSVAPIYLRPPDAKPTDIAFASGFRGMSDNVMPFRNIKLVSLLWAEPERAAELAQLHAELFDSPWDEAAIRALLEHPASTSLVAVAGAPKIVIGFVIGQLAADEAEILSIGVAPDWQRIGLGRMLVEGLSRASRRGDARKLHLEVAADNDGAIALYRSLGFKEMRRRKAYYQRAGAPAVDALVLALDL